VNIPLGIDGPRPICALVAFGAKAKTTAASIAGSAMRRSATAAFLE
jgi:hypothetical protein